MAFGASRHKRQSPRTAQIKESKRKFLNSCGPRGPDITADMRLKVFP